MKKKKREEEEKKKEENTRDRSVPNGSDNKNNAIHDGVPLLISDFFYK